MIRFETSHGNFTVELFQKEAPATVENFLKYVDDGFFDGTIFHRIVPGFVIQGGGLTADFANKKTRTPIRNEAKNGLKNTRGSLSMARTSDIGLRRDPQPPMPRVMPSRISAATSASVRRLSIIGTASPRRRGAPRPRRRRASARR